MYSSASVHVTIESDKPLLGSAYLKFLPQVLPACTMAPLYIHCRKLCVGVSLTTPSPFVLVPCCCVFDSITPQRTKPHASKEVLELVDGPRPKGGLRMSREYQEGGPLVEMVRGGRNCRLKRSRGSFLR